MVPQSLPWPGVGPTRGHEKGGGGLLTYGDAVQHGDEGEQEALVMTAVHGGADRGAGSSSSATRSARGGVGSLAPAAAPAARPPSAHCQPLASPAYTPPALGPRSGAAPFCSSPMLAVLPGLDLRARGSAVLSALARGRQAGKQAGRQAGVHQARGPAAGGRPGGPSCLGARSPGAARPLGPRGRPSRWSRSALRAPRRSRRYATPGDANATWLRPRQGMPIL